MRRLLIALPALLTLAGCGLFSAELEIANASVKLKSQDFTGTGVGVPLVKVVTFPIGSDLSIINEKGVTFELRLTRMSVDLIATPTMGDFGDIQSVTVSVLPPRTQILGLAAGYVAANAVGLAVSSRLLSRRLSGLDTHRMVRTTVRCLVAVLPAAVFAVLVQAGLTRLLGRGLTGALASLLAGGGTLLVGYLLTVRRLRVPELDDLLGPVLRRLGLGAR